MLDPTEVPVRLPEPLASDWQKQLERWSGLEPTRLAFAERFALELGADPKTSRSAASRFANGDGGEIVRMLRPERREALEGLLGRKAEQVAAWLRARLRPTEPGTLSVEDLCELEVGVTLEGAPRQPWSTFARNANGARKRIDLEDPWGLRPLLRDRWEDVEIVEASHGPRAKGRPSRAKLFPPAADDVTAWSETLVGTKRCSPEQALRLRQDVVEPMRDGRLQLEDVVRSPEDLLAILVAGMTGNLRAVTARELRLRLAGALAERWEQQDPYVRPRLDVEGRRLLGHWIEHTGGLAGTASPPELERIFQLNDRPAPRAVEVLAALHGDESSRAAMARRIAPLCGGETLERLQALHLITVSENEARLAPDLVRWANLRVPTEATPKDVSAFGAHPDGLAWLTDAVQLADDLAPWVDTAIDAPTQQQPETLLAVLEGAVRRAAGTHGARSDIERLWASTLWMVLHGLHEPCVPLNDWNLHASNVLEHASEKLAELLPLWADDPYAHLRELVPASVRDVVGAWRAEPPDGRGSDSAPPEGLRREYDDRRHATIALLQLAPFQVDVAVMIDLESPPRPSVSLASVVLHHARRGSPRARRALLCPHGEHHLPTAWWVNGYRPEDVPRDERWSWWRDLSELSHEEAVSMVREVLHAVEQERALTSPGAALLRRAAQQLPTAGRNPDLVREALGADVLDLRKRSDPEVSLAGLLRDSDVRVWPEALAVEVVAAANLTHVLDRWCKPSPDLIEHAARTARWTAQPHDEAVFPALARLARLRHHALLHVGGRQLRAAAQPWRVQSKTVGRARSAAWALGLLARPGHYAAHLPAEHIARLVEVAESPYGTWPQRGPDAYDVLWSGLGGDGRPTPWHLAALRNAEAPVAVRLSGWVSTLWRVRDDARLSPVWDTHDPTVGDWDEPGDLAERRRRALLQRGDATTIAQWVLEADEWLLQDLAKDVAAASATWSALSQKQQAVVLSNLPEGPLAAPWWQRARALDVYDQYEFARKHGDEARQRAAAQQCLDEVQDPTQELVSRASVRVLPLDAAVGPRLLELLRVTASQQSPWDVLDTSAKLLQRGHEGWLDSVEPEALARVLQHPLLAALQDETRRRIHLSPYRGTLDDVATAVAARLPPAEAEDLRQLLRAAYERHGLIPPSDSPRVDVDEALRLIDSLADTDERAYDVRYGCYLLLDHGKRAAQLVQRIVDRGRQLRVAQSGVLLQLLGYAPQSEVRAVVEPLINLVKPREDEWCDWATNLRDAAQWGLNPQVARVARARFPAVLSRGR